MRNRARLLSAAVLCAPLATSFAAQHPASASRPPTPGSDYRLALPGYRYAFPRDHFDHPDFRSEWWYYTGNLRAPDGRAFGFELTFFRQAAGRARPARTGGAGVSVWDVRDLYLAHLALSDLGGGVFLHEARVNRAGPGLAGVEERSGAIWNGNWSAEIAGDKHTLRAVADRFAVHLELAAQKPPVINGQDGVSQKSAGAGHASHYVSLTRLGATGDIEIGGHRWAVTGLAWMDHEFFTHQLAPDQRGWDWLSLQLEDGTDLMVYRLRRADGTVDPFSAGTLVARDGRPTHLTASEFTMTPEQATWTSPETQAAYPIAWRVRVPARGLDLLVDTPLPAQELVGRLGWTPTYWEGAVTARGQRGGAPAGGHGYLEMTGYDKPVTLGPAGQD